MKGTYPQLSRECRTELATPLEGSASKRTRVLTTNENFADGLTEEMISHLGQLNPGRLGVITRTTVVR